MGVQERKQREKASRGLAILGAAKTVFQAKGLLAATIDDIAAEAEIGKGTLYRYYRSKEDIMLALYEEAFGELHRGYVAAVAQGGSGLDKMLRTLRVYFRFTLDNPAYFGFIAFFESPFTTVPPARLAASTAAVRQLIRGLHEEGLADGSIRPGVRADLTADTFWATAYGMLQFISTQGGYIAEDKSVEPDELFDTYLDILAQGMRAHP